MRLFMATAISKNTVSRDSITYWMRITLLLLVLFLATETPSLLG